MKLSILKSLMALHLVVAQVALSCYGQHQKDQPYVLMSNISYLPNDTLKADFYLPSNYKSQENPVLVFIDGFGGDFRKSAHYTGWAKLAASEGFVGVVYSARENYIRECFSKLLDFIINVQETYLIDTKRISVYAGSGNVLNGLPLANEDNRIKAALMYYGTAKIENFRLNLPVLLVRAGLDNIQLNKSLDSLALKAFAANAPYTVTNFNTALHAFEDFSDSISLPCMKNSLDFLREKMQGGVQKNILEHEQEVIGMRELYQSNWKAALEAYKHVLKNDPGNNEAERQAGNICMEMKEYTEALDYYDSALVHGNWRKGEIALKKLYAYAKLNNICAAVIQMDLLRKIGWFKEADYSGKKEYANIIKSEAYRRFIAE